MAWINEQAFFERSLRNELISLRALRAATAVIATQHGTLSLPETYESLAAIDEAIEATQQLINSGMHHK